MQTERNLKIYEMSGYQYKPTPTIMLKGQWLADLGFEAGNRIYNRKIRLCHYVHDGYDSDFLWFELRSQYYPVDVVSL